MKKYTLCSFRILKYQEQSLIKGEFDFAVEIEYKKSQVTEQEAINCAIKQINETLPNNLCARIADAEQYISIKNGKVVMQIGIDLFTKS